MFKFALLCIFIVLINEGTAFKIDTSYLDVDIENVNDEDELRGIFEDIVNNTLQGLKDSIPDPIVIDLIELDQGENTLLSGGANISALTITGLKGFLVPYLKIQVLSMKMDFVVSFPALNINTQYWADLLLMDLIPLYGSGKANINFSNITINGTGTVGLSNGISLKDLHVYITMNDAVFDFHGLLDNEEFSLIFNTILNDVVADFFNEHQKLISDILSPILQVIFNQILHPDPAPTTTPNPLTTPNPTTELYY